MRSESVWKRRRDWEITAFDWMSCPTLHALSADEAGEWCDEQPWTQESMMFLEKEAENRSEAVTLDPSSQFAWRKTSEFVWCKCFGH